ncbi:MAG: tRNA (N(6)-L-threonylcarbamoyladenosine(37)-C(2))-methylthiotransferase MtaB [Bdellovibrionales bacterium]|nr:tRNA (N(6)-L-threonylcarbamoyladenosine(37)-C(2))-methylthiotransferase MtaB [Bdellovibrionales bacterium]
MDSLKNQQTPKFHTFGCKVNTYDTGLLESRLAAARLVTQGEQPKIHILNTCAVTAQATREAERQIRRIKAKDPFAMIVVTGCAAQVDTDQFAEMRGVDLIVANSHKGELETIIKKYLVGESRERVFKSNIFKKLELEAGGGQEKEHTRAFLKVQDGCNSFCTYCVIPFARGKSRSISIRDLVLKVNQLYDQGVKEVVITGIHIGDYESDGEPLEALMEALLGKTKMPRFRISSLEPPEITDRLLDLYKDSRMCPHFHMSIQSANDSVLKDMKRNYLAQDVEDVLNRLDEAVPGVFIGMDVIVGFPGETEEQFQDTVERLMRTPWSRLHVFPYSERQGTYAVRLPHKVNGAEIAHRAKELRRLSEIRYQQEVMKQIGTTK